MLRVDYDALQGLAQQTNLARVALEQAVLRMHEQLSRVLPGAWTGDGYEAFVATYAQHIRAANGINQTLLDIEKTLLTCEDSYALNSQSIGRNFQRS